VWLGLGLRLAAFPFAENLYGDAPVRTELAERWAAQPGPFWSQSQVFQFGPLPLHLGGLAIKLGLGHDTGPRLWSLVAGVACILLAMRLGARLWGPGGGIAAGALVALSPLHLQASTTFVSEALYLCFVLLAIDRSWSRALPGAALALFAATTTRYDAWLWVPLWVAWWAWSAEGRRLRAGLFAVLAAAPGPASLLLANGLDHGDPLGPLRYIAVEHVALAQAAVAQHGPVLWRLWSVAYWPLALVLVLTPGFFVVLARSALRWQAAGRDRWLPLVAGFTPPLLYAGKGLWSATFWPMSRLALAPAVLGGLALPPLGRTTLLRCVAVALAFDAALAGLTLSGSGWGARVGPISPLSRLPDDWRAGAQALREGPANAALDRMPGWEDIPIAYHSGRNRFDLQRSVFEAPPERIVAIRGGDYDRQLAASGTALGARYVRTGGVGRVSWWDRAP
jgi:hypothetical protein